MPSSGWSFAEHALAVLEADEDERLNAHEPGQPDPWQGFLAQQRHCVETRRSGAGNEQDLLLFADGSSLLLREQQVIARDHDEHLLRSYVPLRWREDRGRP